MRFPACVIALLALVTAAAGSAMGSVPLRVLLVVPDAASVRELAPLHDGMAKTPGVHATLAGGGSGGSASPRLGALREADAAVFLHGPGALGAADAALLRDYLDSGKGVVVLDAVADAWPTEPDFLKETLGAVRVGPFAGGAPLTLINLFPHPVFTGISRLEAIQAIARFDPLAADAQMIMEGTVGEATAPLGWVRRRNSGRLCHLVPAGPVLLADASYQRLVTNAALWSADRPVPGAVAAVQRTYMPDAHPGAFAITLPNGPGVCLDPVRGGINYIWDGDFVDLRPRWITKVGEPARIFGEIFYRETGWQPLRAGAPGGEPDFRFRGYTLDEGLPEFHYEVGGRVVRERLASVAGGAGLVRRFRVGPGAVSLWLTLEPQPEAEVTVRGLERDGSLATFAQPAGGEFTIEIRRKPAVRP